MSAAPGKFTTIPLNRGKGEVHEERETKKTAPGKTVSFINEPRRKKFVAPIPKEAKGKEGGRCQGKGSGHKI